MANWLSFRENLNCQAFREAGDRLAASDVLTHSYEAGWKTPNNEYLRSMPSPQISLLVTFFSKAVIKVLPAFEPCLLQPFRSLRTIWKAGFETN